MGITGDIFRTKAFHQTMVARWVRSDEDQGQIASRTLARSRRHPNSFRKLLGKKIHITEDGLSLPVIDPNCRWMPHNADWAWRPGIWRNPLFACDLSSIADKSKLSDDITLFHDCPAPDLHLSQQSNKRHNICAPSGLRFEIFEFSGSFLSLAIDYPKDAIDGLKRNHILRVAAVIEMAQPLTVFARLNIQHGPNTEQILREFSLEDIETSVEFDLAYADLNEKRIEGAWLDLIFEAPKQNRITLRDLTFSRRPRAQV
ncbi:MAG: DUF6478 family protein [Roseobacter sp.]